MGLDMYLNRKTYVQNWDHMRPEDRTEVTVLLGGNPHPRIDTSKISYIIEQVAYWRKANHIHNWFVNNCQGGVDNCQEAYVEHDKIDEIVSLCKRVLVNHKLAHELLPTTSGFFFGGTEYDEYYFQSLQDTIDMLGNLDYNSDYYYEASW